VLIGGGFSKVNGITWRRIARLNGDGTLDSTLDSSVGPDRTVWAIAVQNDGKILIGGEFTTVNGAAHNRLARYNANGTLDTNFTIGAFSTDIAVYSLVVQPDGKVLVGGYFSFLNNMSRRCIARLNADGSLDSTFLSPNPDTQVSSVAIQPDGKVLIAGYFTLVSSTNRNRIARLNSNGSLDASFNPGTGADMAINSVALQPDGKVVIVGNFTSFNGTNRLGIARLNADGSLDTSFDPGSGFDGTVTTVAAWPGGKALIGGTFSTFNQMSRPFLALIDQNGGLDTSLALDAGPNNSVHAIVIRPEGQVLIGGTFTTFNGVPRVRVARLFGVPPLSIRSQAGNVVLSWPTNLIGYTLQSAPQLADSSQWLDSTNIPVPTGTDWAVTNVTSGGVSFYRLKK
jgi:uncharacterized delta-60 repeat protein